MSSQPSQTQTDSDEEGHHPRAQADQGAQIARLKRRLAASQEEVKELSQGKVKKPPYVDLCNPLSRPVILLIYLQDNRHDGTGHPTLGHSVRIP